MSPVLMPPAHLRALCPYDVIVAGNVVACHLLSPRWKSNGARVLSTLVRPVLHRIEPRPWPNMLFQQCLVRALLLPTHPAQGVRDHVSPGVCPEFSRLSSNELGPPATTNYWHPICVLRYLLKTKKLNTLTSSPRGYPSCNGALSRSPPIPTLQPPPSLSACGHKKKNLEQIKTEKVISVLQLMGGH